MPFETVFTYALYFFALNDLVMFGPFFLFNDWALRFLFRYPLRAVLANSPSEDSPLGEHWHDLSPHGGQLRPLRATVT